MKGIAIGSPHAEVAPGYPVAAVECRGEATGGRFAPADFPLWVASATVAQGTQLGWDDTHGDEALYVLDGALAVDGAVCRQGGVVVVESSVATSLDVVDGPARVLHFGPHETSPPPGLAPNDARRGVHVIGPGGTHAVVDAERDTRFFADSACPSCRVTLFVTGRTHGGRHAPHSHSADEILYVLHGGIRFGNQAVPPGSAVAVSADRRYSFHGAEHGFAMLNYRSRASWFSSPTTPTPFLEGGAATGMPAVGDVVR